MIPLTSSASTRDHEPFEPVRPTNEVGEEAEPVPSRQDFLQYALEFRGWGWTVLALNADKKPVARWRRLQTHRTSDRELCRMFDRPDVGGLAVVLGTASGGRGWVLGCRDFDAAAGYRHWSRSRPRLAEALPTVETRRGFHVYARMSGPDLFLSFPKGEMAGELRASRKQFAVLPPSLRGDAVGYRWRPRRPSSLNDFPVLRVEDTGFLEAIPSPKAGFKNPSRRVRKPQDDLCVIRGPLDALNLPSPVREALYRTLPRRAGQRNEKLFKLAQSLRDCFVATTPVRDLAPAVLAWWQLATPALGTKEWTTTWDDFRRGWRAVKVPLSQTRPKRAMRAAAAGLEQADPAARLLAVCRALAADSRNGEFFLSCRDAGDAIGVSFKTASVRINEAVANGSLVLVKKGVPDLRSRMSSIFRIAS